MPAELIIGAAGEQLDDAHRLGEYRDRLDGGVVALLLVIDRGEIEEIDLAVAILERDAVDVDER